MFITPEAFNSGIAECEREIEEKTRDVMSGKCVDEKRVIQYVHGIQFALSRMKDASDRALGKKRKDEDGADS